MRKVVLVLPLALVASGVVLSFQNCSKVKFSPVTTGVGSLSSTGLPGGSELVIQPPVCNFDGKNIPDGESVTSYQNSAVPFGKTCVSEARTCSSGALSGSYAYSSCVVGQPASCLFNGVTYLHGQTVPAFQNSSVPYGSTCQAQVRVCTNGELSGSYSYANCEVGKPATCLFDGKTVEHGGSVISYQNSTVPFGSACVQEARACVNGKLAGSYNYGTCAVAAPAVCKFNGATIAHGQTVVSYQSSSVAFGANCVSETRSCSNGVLSGSYSFASCAAAAPAACMFNGATVAHGQSVAGYATSTVAFGASCASENRVCNNGVLSGSNSFGSCSVAAPASCMFNGVTVAHGQVVTAFQSPIVGTGGACSTEGRTCSNGSLLGSYTYASCEALPGCIGSNKNIFTSSTSWAVPAGARYFCVRLIGGGGGGSGAGGDNGDNGYGGYAAGYSEQVYASALVPVGSVLNISIAGGGGGGGGVYAGNNSMNGAACGAPGGTSVVAGPGVSQTAAGGAGQCLNAPGGGGSTPGAQNSVYTSWSGGAGSAGAPGACNANGNTGYPGVYGGGGGGGAGPHQCGGGRGAVVYGRGGAGGNGYAEITWSP